jgi:hypothetical protein
MALQTSASEPLTFAPIAERCAKSQKPSNLCGKLLPPKEPYVAGLAEANHATDLSRSIRPIETDRFACALLTRADSIRSRRICASTDIWLGDQDSNLDKVRQRHLTYH